MIFHAQIAADEGRWDVDDVAEGLVRKLVHRHPHVFGDVDEVGCRRGPRELGAAQGRGDRRSQGGRRRHPGVAARARARREGSAPRGRAGASNGGASSRRPARAPRRGRRAAGGRNEPRATPRRRSATCCSRRSRVAPLGLDAESALRRTTTRFALGRSGRRPGDRARPRSPPISPTNELRALYDEANGGGDRDRGGAGADRRDAVVGARRTRHPGRDRGAFGSAVFTDDFPGRYDSNFLRVEQPVGSGAPRAARRRGGPAAGAPERTAR